MSYQQAVVPSGAVSIRENVLYTGDVTTSLLVLGAVAGMASDCGWTNSAIPGFGINFTSVPTPGLGTTVSLQVWADAFGNVFFKPTIGGVTQPQASPFHPAFYSFYYFWMNKYGFFSRANVSDPVGLSFFEMSALYVPPEMQGTAITAGGSAYYYSVNQLVSGGFPFATSVNGSNFAGPVGGSTGDFVPINYPLILAGSGADCLTSNARAIQQTAYVALATSNNTEGKIAGILCDAFISLDHSPDRSKATGPDGRTYYMWAGTQGAPPTIGHENLWLATSTM